MRAVLLILFAGCLAAADTGVSEAWSRATVPGQEAGAVFCVIAGGDTADRLLTVEGDAARSIEIHEHATGADGVMQMRAVDGGLAVPAASRVVLKPRSYHIMLIGLRTPLAKGASIPLTFVFRHAGRVRIEALVLDPWAMAYDDR